MIANDNAGRLVRVLFNFTARNNDELNLSKNDIIILTQTPDGGWWEGTYEGRTGWFPSNYVQVLPKDAVSSFCGDPYPLHSSELKQYRENSLAAILKYEEEHVKELEHFIRVVIRPLVSANLFSSNDFVAMSAILEDNLKIHSHLLNLINESIRSAQGIGAVFLQLAPSIQNVMERYATLHPKIVFLFASNQDSVCRHFSQTNQEEFMISINKNLSVVFRNIERYPPLLKDVERTYEESHFDRGDIQRAIEYYKQLATSVENIRRKKELEIEVISSNIVGWEGEPLSSLGPPLSVAQVLWQRDSDTSELRERILFLYSSLLVAFSYNSQHNEYRFENKYILSSLIVNPETTANQRTIELTGPLLQRFILTFSTSVEHKQWRDLLSRYTGHVSSPKPITRPASPVVNCVHPAKSSPKSPSQRTHLWSHHACLRPHPASRNREVLISSDGSKSFRRLRSMRKTKAAAEMLRRFEHCESDALLLAVIECYHKSSAPIIQKRSFNESGVFGSMLSNATSDDKMFIPADRNIFDVISRLNQQMQELQAALKNLKRDLEEERRARIRLEHDIEADRVEIGKLKFGDNR